MKKTYIFEHIMQSREDEKLVESLNLLMNDLSLTSFNSNPLETDEHFHNAHHKFPFIFSRPIQVK